MPRRAGWRAQMSFIGRNGHLRAPPGPPARNPAIIWLYEANGDRDEYVQHGREGRRLPPRVVRYLRRVWPRSSLRLNPIRFPAVHPPFRYRSPPPPATIGAQIGLCVPARTTYICATRDCLVFMNSPAIAVDSRRLMTYNVAHSHCGPSIDAL